MNSLLSRLFSDRYANHAAIGNNLLLLLMYRFAYPFAVLLGRAGFGPNLITSLSLAGAIGAALVLWLDAGRAAFIAFWGLALLLDFCDGTVARMTDSVRRVAFRYDHSSDLCKIFIVILAAGARYDDGHLWAVAMTASFMFMFFAVVNHDLGVARQRNAGGVAADKSTARAPARPSLLKAGYAALCTINGQTLLIFFTLPFGRDCALAGLGYLAALSAFRAAICIHVLIRLPK